MEKLVILRATGQGGPGFLNGGPQAFGMNGRVPVIAIEVAERTPANVAAAAGSADVVAIAPAMPMKLIKPFAASAGAAAAPGPNWGVGAVRADVSAYSGDGIVVAVLDTGIDSGHAAFNGVNLVKRNFSGDANGADLDGHGTHCAGVIFGRDVAGARIGVARGVKTALIGKVLGQNGGGSDVIVQAVQWAVEEGANVISMSLGIDFAGYVDYLIGTGVPVDVATSKALEGYRANVTLFERLASLVRAMSAFRQPCVIVAAAGNESRRDDDPTYRIAVSPPAVADGIISVAAVGRDANNHYLVAPFSNTGAMVAGPGVDISSAKAGGGLVAFSGTSMATPHVAGVAALYGERLLSNGQLSTGLLAAKIVGSGDLTGFGPGLDPGDVGSGLVQAP